MSRTSTPIAPEAAPLGAPHDEYWRAPRGPGLLGRLVRLVLYVALALLAFAAGLLAVLAVAAPPRVSVLILGTDQRPDQAGPRGDPGRTDSMILLVADRASPLAAMVSIPRDLYVPIPGHGEERINAAYRIGEYERPGSGPDLASRTVAAALGVPVDRYALVDFRGMARVVDALGGIEVLVEHEIVDNAYPTDDYGVRRLMIPAGWQHFDGETALAYARTRHQDSDFGRMARQQQVLGAIRAALLQPSAVPRWPAVAAATLASVRSDLGPAEAFTLLLALARTGGEPDHLVVDERLVQPITGSDGAYLLVPTPRLKPAVAAVVGAAPPDLPVEVLNGAGVPGLARRSAETLAERGFRVTGVGDADRLQERSTIEAPPDARRAGLLAAEALGLPASAVTTGAGPGLRIVLGRDAAGR